jgi:hypothetical protein
MPSHVLTYAYPSVHAYSPIHAYSPSIHAYIPLVELTCIFSDARPGFCSLKYNVYLHYLRGKCSANGFHRTSAQL